MESGKLHEQEKRVNSPKTERIPNSLPGYGRKGRSEGSDV